MLTPAGKLILAVGRDILQTTARLANKAKETATGWEPRLSIAVESLQYYPSFFRVLQDFLKKHATVEIGVCESVLNGGWEALERGRVDLIVGAPGPVPLQKGYRAIPLARAELVPVIAASHTLANVVTKPEELLAKVRRVITHDTSMFDVTRSAGLSGDGQIFYVQNIDQKVAAKLAGIGIGHLPRERIQWQIDTAGLG